MGGEPLLYHQLALRLALEGYDVTGIGPQAVNAKLRREIEDAGGSFQSSSISEISGGDTALAVLASNRPFEALNWAAQHRIHISSEPRAPTSPRWKSAVITYPVELAQVVLADIVDQVTRLLDCPPAPTRFGTVRCRAAHSSGARSGRPTTPPIRHRPHRKRLQTCPPKASKCGPPPTGTACSRLVPTGRANG
ncbi:hypothetical protein MF271_20480 (plasmid) [Deinococcus sp. KNUC1210]|uniref:hypothetical protein n=1 Tax=Deinococcus sp. KNUC1210 TaxID=2917691 RepID=UPI001EF05253|nr:hypothetical protein [Deinococcus sp. KNUC1210]ULH17781.1 hypothetical protein MF271_20480 [Deinococcus sp. KNUC1210]